MTRAEGFSVEDNALGQRDNWNAVRGWECGEVAPILNHGEATSQSQFYVERSDKKLFIGDSFSIVLSSNTLLSLLLLYCEDILLSIPQYNQV